MALSKFRFTNAFGARANARTSAGEKQARREEIMGMEIAGFVGPIIHQMGEHAGSIAPVRLRVAESVSTHPDGFMAGPFA